MKKRETILPFDIAPAQAALTAQGGLILPYETAQALNLPKVIDRELPVPGSGRGYRPSEVVIPLMLMLHGGGKKLDDLREIEAEANLRDLLGMKGLPASCTIGDWLRRMGRNGPGMPGLERVNDHLTRRGVMGDKGEAYTLDIDAVVIESEKSEAQWTYKKEKGYQPLLGFLYELGLIVRDEFREGNVPAGSGIKGFLENCCGKMPEGKRIGYFRSDSAGYQAEVIDFCLEKGILFTITADKDRAVMRAIQTIREGEWEAYEKGREVAETVHTMNGTKGAFRLIVQRWRKLQGDLFDPDPYCYHVIATNREEEPIEVIGKHNQRGQAENYIKELVNGFGLEWMPCRETYANAVFFRIGVLAYNLFLLMKRMVLFPWYRNSTIATVRWKLYQTAGMVVSHARRLTLKLAASLDKIAQFCVFRRKCFRMATG
jgi:hypothetical protein